MVPCCMSKRSLVSIRDFEDRLREDDGIEGWSLSSEDTMLQSKKRTCPVTVPITHIITGPIDETFLITWGVHC